MIRGVCKFRGDDPIGAETWPDTFCIAPRVGDWVKSRKGTLAKVVGVTHCLSSNALVVGYPSIEVEIAR
jgi:hypothetical protein